MVSRRSAAVVLLASRFIYAANWYNLSPAVDKIQQSYGISISEVGLIFTTFLVGAAVFQIPSGMFASRIGSKNCSMIGILLMTASDVAAYFAPNFYLLLLYRAINGVGAAFFFSSALAVLSEVYPEKITSIVWIYNAAFNLGGGFGILLMAGLMNPYSWVANSLLMGAMTSPFILFIYLLVPQSEALTKIDLGSVRSKILDLRIWMIAIGFSGFWTSTYEYPEFLKQYLSSSGYTGLVPGAIGSISLIAGLSGLVLIPFVRGNNQIKKSLILSICAGMGIIALPLLGLTGILLVTIGEAALFVLVSALEYVVVIGSEPDRKYRPLRLGLFNSIQISLGSVFSFIFAFLVSFGFAYAWEFLGIISIVLLPAVFFGKGTTSLQTPGHS